jgi:hypothetical protein
LPSCPDAFSQEPKVFDTLGRDSSFSSARLHKNQII